MCKNNLSILEVDTKRFSADDLIFNVSKKVSLIEYLQTVWIPLVQSEFSKFGILQSIFWGKRQFGKRRCNLKWSVVSRLEIMISNVPRCYWDVFLHLFYHIWDVLKCVIMLHKKVYDASKMKTHSHCCFCLKIP